MEPVLTVAFVAAVVAFFKWRGLVEGHALLAAFGVALFVGIAPLLAALIPPSVPFVDVVIQVITLFLAAAGGYDLIVDLKQV
jgi:hypothetical protein